MHVPAFLHSQVKNFVLSVQINGKLNGINGTAIRISDIEHSIEENATALSNYVCKTCDQVFEDCACIVENVDVLSTDINRPTIQCGTCDASKASCTCIRS